MRREAHISGAVVLVVSVCVTGATIRVPQDQLTIQTGIDAAVTGDTVLVSPGTYREVFSFRGKAIVVTSEAGPAQTVVDNRYGGATTVLFDHSETSTSILDGFTFLGGPIALRCIDAGPIIRRNVFRAQTYGSWAALVIEGPAKIINNTVVGGANGGIACYTSDAVIKNNIVAFNGHYGIHSGDPVLNLSYNDVYGNPVNYSNQANAGYPSISLDPQFTDTVAGDYSLKPSSPCVDAGDPAFDYLDPDGSRNDMGAISQVPGLPWAFDFRCAEMLPDYTVPTLQPVFFWRPRADSGRSQTAYEIEMGSDLDWTVAEQWSTGQAFSTDTSVAYGGSPLEDHRPYWCRIRLYDGASWGPWRIMPVIPRITSVIRVPGDRSTIQLGIDAAVAGDTVLVAPGVYTEGLLFRGKAIVVRSEAGAAQTVISGFDQRFAAGVWFGYNESRETVLEGFTISGGQSAIWCINSSPTIRYNILTDQWGDWGSALEISGWYGSIGRPSPAIINNTICNGAGNGIHVASKLTPTIRNNIVAFNRRVGIYNSGSNLDIGYNDVYNNNGNYTGVTNPGLGAMSIDPVFVDLANRDFALALSSPCIDVGDPSPEYDDPDGSWADMGALTTGSTPFTHPFARRFSILGMISNSTVLTVSPKFIWSFVDSASSAQVAYQIEIGTDADWTSAEIWASGAMTSSDTSVAYAGTLGNRAWYYARCRVFNGTVWGSWSVRPFFVKAPRHIDIPDQYYTFQSAADASEYDDTVLVAPGGYFDHVSVKDKRVHFVSSGGAGVTQLKWDGQGDGPIVFTGASGGSVAGFNWMPSDLGDKVAISCQSGTFSITGNMFDNLRGTAIITASGPGTIRIERNVFAAPVCSDHAIAASEATVQLINNTIDSTEKGALLSKTGSVAENNIFSRCRQYALSGGNSTALSEKYNCFWRNAVDRVERAIDPTDITADPLFWDPLSSDYRLWRGSPCIDGGDPEVTFNDPDGSRNDVGALAASGDTLSPCITNLFIPDEIRFHVITRRPTFVWSYGSPTGSLQEQYEIQVNRGNFWNDPDVWNDGPVFGSDTQAVFNGFPLYYGKSYNMRLRIKDAFRWSEWRQYSFHLNAAPTMPVPVWPVEVTTNNLPALTIQNSSDLDRDSLWYDFEIYNDTLLSQIVRSMPHIPEANPTTAKVSAALPDNRRFWWRVRASDGVQTTDWSAASRFWVNSGPDAPWAVQLISPDDAISGPIFTPTPRFIWSKGFDPDPIDFLKYRLQLAITPNFAFNFTYDDLTDTTFQLVDSLPENTHFWWRVYAIDSYGLVSVTAPSRDFWTWTIGDIDGSHNVDISDLSRLIDFLFIGGAPLVPPNAGDVDGDCKVDIADLSLLIDHLFVNMSPLVKGCAASGPAVASGTTRPAGRLVFPKVSVVNDDDRLTEGER